MNERRIFRCSVLIPRSVHRVLCCLPEDRPASVFRSSSSRFGNISGNNRCLYHNLSVFVTPHRLSVNADLHIDIAQIIVAAPLRLMAVGQFHLLFFAFCQGFFQILQGFFPIYLPAVFIGRQGDLCTVMGCELSGLSIGVDLICQLVDKLFLFRLIDRIIAIFILYQPRF